MAAFRKQKTKRIKALQEKIEVLKKRKSNGSPIEELRNFNHHRTMISKTPEVFGTPSKGNLSKI